MYESPPQAWPQLLHNVRVSLFCCLPRSLQHESISDGKSIPAAASWHHCMVLRNFGRLFVHIYLLAIPVSRFLGTYLERWPA